MHRPSPRNPRAARQAFLVTVVTALALGPILGVAEIVAVFYWFSLVEGFGLGQIRLEVLAFAYGMALPPAFIGGILLALIDQIVVRRIPRLVLTGAAGFVATFAGLTLLLGAGDVRGAIMAGLVGVLPAYGCSVATARLLRPRQA